MRKIQKTAVVGGTVAVLLAGGVAFAAWTSTGIGSGDVTAGQDSEMTVSAVSSDLLYPTKSVDLTVTVENNDPYPLNLDSVTPVSITSDKGAACAISALHASTDTYAEDATSRIAESGSIDKTLTLSMDADAAEGCKNAVFTVTYDAVAHAVN
jgi:hypothetical protein